MAEINSYVWDSSTRKWIYVGGSSSAKIYYDTTDGWNAQIDLIAEKQCLYIYTDWIKIVDDYGNESFQPGVKVGDGSTYLIDVPFIEGTVKEALDQHIADIDAHVSAEDREFWNNKCRAVAEVENETAVFTMH